MNETLDMPEGMEPDVYMFQNDETGQVQFVDAQQVEWGFQESNPQLLNLGPVFTGPQVQSMLDAARRAQEAKTYRAVCDLADDLFYKHFRHEPDYASGQIEWSLCDTTEGVISQIDNMVCGLVQPSTQSLETKDGQQSTHFWNWIRRAYGKFKSANFTVYNMEVAYQAGYAHAAYTLLPDGCQVVPIEPTSKQIVMMAGEILHQQHGTADSRHLGWAKAVEQAERAYHAMIEAAPKSVPKSQNDDKWRLAMDEEMIASHLGTAEPHHDPKTVLNKLLKWNIGVALDPKVSPAARALQNQARTPLAPINVMRLILDVERNSNHLRGSTNWAVAIARAVEGAHDITPTQENKNESR